MALLAFVTLGIYFPYWLLSRRERLNALSSDQKLWQRWLVAVLVWSIVNAVIGSASIVQPGLANNPIVNLLGLILGVVLIVSVFRVRRILLNHLAAAGRAEDGVSWAATLFFSLYYLQYKINRFASEGLLEARQSL